MGIEQQASDKSTIPIKQFFVTMLIAVGKLSILK